MLNTFCNHDPYSESTEYKLGHTFSIQHFKMEIVNC